MARRLHIHLHSTQDSGKFDESKHPRDHGKFSSAEGGSGMTAEAKAARIKLLLGMLDKLDASAPLAAKVKITTELKSLGWGRSAPEK